MLSRAGRTEGTGGAAREFVHHVVEHEEHEHKEEGHVAHDLTVGSSSAQHLLYPARAGPEEPGGPVEVGVDPVQQPVTVLGFCFDVESEGLEVTCFMRESILVLPVLYIYGILGVSPPVSSHCLLTHKSLVEVNQ